MSTLKIVIVGTGGSGLAAAQRLVAAGHEVTLLEKANRIGGRAATVKWHNFDLEIGASVLTSQDKPVLEYVNKFGLELVAAPGGLNITVPKNGKLYTANFLNPFSLLSWGAVSFGARLSILKLMLPIIARTISLKGDTYHLEKGPDKDDSLSFYAQFSKQIGSELLEQCFMPMMETMMGYKKDDLSWKAFLSLMAVYMGGKSMAIKGGMSVLTTKLAEGLNLILEAEVKKVSVVTGDKAVEIEFIRNGKLEKLLCDKVILAVPGNKTLSLINPNSIKPAWEKFFKQVKYSSGAMQYLLLKTKFSPNVPMVYLPSSTGHKINQISFEAQNDTYLLAMTDPRVETQWQNLSDSELAEISMQVIEQYFPQLKGTMEDQITFRWDGLVPTLGPGYLTALSEFKLNRQEDPIYFAGDWHNSPNFAGAMASGIEVAQRILGE